MQNSPYSTKVSQPSLWDIKNIVCFIPIISLAIAYFAYTFFYSEFTETDLSKTILATGLKPAEVMIIKAGSLTETDIAALNNKAYAARSTWSVFAFLHVCVCITALIIGVYLIFAAMKKYSRWYPLGISVLYFLYITPQLLHFNLAGNYHLIIQLLQQTIQVAEYSGFPQILIYAILLNKLSFFVATLLAIAAGMTLLDKPISKNKKDTHSVEKNLREQMGLLQITLYVGTIILISAIILWSFTLRWALAYIYPWDGPVYKSIESLISSQITSSGIYYSVLLALSYVPVAAIHHYRASKLAEQEKPAESPKEQSDWLKENGLSISPMELMPRIVAILGPLLAGSITELIKVVQ